MNLFIFIIIAILIVIFKFYMQRSPSESLESEQLIRKYEPLIQVRVFDEMYSSKILRARPSCLFLFGDNENHAGKKGQAIIRHEPNAVGITTKKHPFMNEDSFYNDVDYELNVLAIDQSFADLRNKIESSGMKYTSLFIPAAGLGTGLAQLPKRAPKTFVYLLSQLYDLTEEYDPQALESTVGRWIESQMKLVRGKNTNNG
jgi:hypothetical protein